MPTSSTPNFKVGALLTIALLILMGGLVSIGGRQRLFARNNSYMTYFSSVGGLQPGAPAQFHGVRVGVVKDVTLSTDPHQRKIRVKLSIERRYAPLVRSDTVAQIKTLGLLGDKFVFLSSKNDPKAVTLKSHSVIRTLEPVDYEKITRRSEDIVTNVADISSTMRQLLLSLERGDTLLGKLMSDPNFARQSFADFESMIADWKKISDSIQSGKSLAGRFLTDEPYGKYLSEEIKDTSQRINRLVKSVDEGRGFAGKLLAPSEENETLYANLKDFSEALKIISDEMQKGEGFLPALMKSSPEGRGMVKDFHASLHSLASIMDKLDTGKGSAGLFLNRPEVYHNVENIVGAINKSKMSKWYLHRKARKGERLRREMQEEEKKKAREEKKKSLLETSEESTTPFPPAAKNAPQAPKSETGEPSDGPASGGEAAPDSKHSELLFSERDPFVEPSHSAR